MEKHLKNFLWFLVIVALIVIVVAFMIYFLIVNEPLKKESSQARLLEGCIGKCYEDDDLCISSLTESSQKANCDYKLSDCWNKCIKKFPPSCEEKCKGQYDLYGSVTEYNQCLDTCKNLNKS